MKHPIIKLHKISKRYFLKHSKPTLVETLFSPHNTDSFWALKDINININQGEKVGIIGSNGSGKTTLLEIIAGITKPTKGHHTISGTVASLLDLEAGFHPELNGLENIIVNGMIIGMTKNKIRQQFNHIVEFADIGRFINAPLFTYSLGMKLRLGFAIAIHSYPDILLLDEGMAVGDSSFQQKCFSAIDSLLNSQTTLIMVSHHTNFIKNHASRILWLNKGKIITDNNDPKATISQYLQSTTS